MNCRELRGCVLQAVERFPGLRAGFSAERGPEPSNAATERVDASKARACTQSTREVGITVLLAGAEEKPCTVHVWMNAHLSESRWFAQSK